MNSVIYKLLEPTRGEAPINEGLELVSVVGVISASEQNVETGIKLPSTIKIEDLITNKENTKERLIELIEKSEIDNNLLKECMKNTISQSKISDKNLQNIIANIQHIDLKNTSKEFINVILDSESSVSKLGEDGKEPESIKKITTNILEIERGTVYDGVCGNGDFLIEASNLQRKDDIKLYGQEENLKRWMMAQINLRMNGITNFNIEYGDTLKDPKFRDGLKLDKFDYVTMDIPFSMRPVTYEEIQEDLYGRYKYGVPSKNNLHYAFIQHAIASLKDNGKAAIVVPMGVLFREAAEGKIRRNLVNDDIIEGIISLPPVYTTTSIPVAIMVLNKDKNESMKEKIFFIKGEDLRTRDRRTTVLSEEQINKIINLYTSKIEEEDFSRLVDTKEIAENNYNLIVGKYIIDYTVVTEEGVINLDINKFESQNETINFKDIAKFERGMNLPKASEESTKTHKAITLSDVQDGELILDNLTDIELNDIKRIEKYTVKKGDILLSCRGNAIKIAVVEDIPDNIIVSNNFIKITPNYNINPYFIKEYLESPVGQYYLNLKQTGTTIKVLSATDLYDMKVPMLSIEEQNKVAQKSIDSKKEYNEGLKKLQEKLKNDTLSIYDMLGLSKVIK
ncbi:N-6 DNA methylase [Romboutsia timonensis]|uniref:N-6 DNA methylase n=1 Tax=Romboutsia timonensis TaxID=1776391 RepID=UPI0008D9CCD2|nr:N-6 DNA methylase [Romboutsia timonensis]